MRVLVTMLTLTLLAVPVGCEEPLSAVEEGADTSAEPATADVADAGGAGLGQRAVPARFRPRGAKISARTPLLPQCPK